MSLALAPRASRWVSIQRGLRKAVPVLLLATLAVVVWLVSLWLLPVALFAVACWRAPDPAQVRFAVELLAAALVLTLTAVAVLITCARGQARNPD